MSLAEGEAHFDADKSLFVVNIEAQLIQLRLCVALLMTDQREANTKRKNPRHKG
jgi:hypothetical protein